MSELAQGETAGFVLSLDKLKFDCEDVLIGS